MKRVGGRGYSLDLRERIVQAVKNGENRNDVARKYAVHRQTVDQYCAKFDLGTLDHVGKSTGRPRKFQAHHEEQLMKQVKEKPDASLAEHGEMLEKGTGLKISEATIHRIFARRRITVKKNGLRHREG